MSLLYSYRRRVSTATFQFPLLPLSSVTSQTLPRCLDPEQVQQDPVVFHCRKVNGLSCFGTEGSQKQRISCSFSIELLPRSLNPAGQRKSHPKHRLLSLTSLPIPNPNPKHRLLSLTSLPMPRCLTAKQVKIITADVLHCRPDQLWGVSASDKRQKTSSRSIRTDRLDHV